MEVEGIFFQLSNRKNKPEQGATTNYQEINSFQQNGNIFADCNELIHVFNKASAPKTRLFDIINHYFPVKIYKHG